MKAAGCGLPMVWTEMETLSQIELDQLYTTVPGLREYVKSKMPEFKKFNNKNQFDTGFDTSDIIKPKK